MRCLLVNDIHAADKPPSSCTDSYQDDLIDLLQQTVSRAMDHGCDAVVWAGDVFHSKAPSRTSHRLVQRIIQVIRAYRCPVFIVPGNHDMAYDRVDSLAETQPLGTLLYAGARLLIGQSRQFPELYGVPWLQGYGPYWETGEAVDGRVDLAFDGWHHHQVRQPLLAVAHAPLYPPGKELPYEFFPASRWAEAMGARGHVWYGHVHEPHGVWQEGGVTFANFGALSRGSLHEYNLHRPVSVGIWDSTSQNFAEIKLTAKPASEVFRLAERDEVTDMQGRLDEFLASIGQAKLSMLNAESVREHVRAEGHSPELVALIEELLEGAQ